MTRALPTEAVELYALVPGEFVAARNALVKQLKRERRAEDAAAVGALRRPSPADHAVNAAVRADADVAAVWVAAVLALDDEQRAAIAGTANHLRAAAAALREANAALVDVAAAGDESRRGAIISTLQGLATRSGAALVSAGIVGAGDPTDDLFAGMPDPVAVARPKQSAAQLAVADGPATRTAARHVAAGPAKRPAVARSSAEPTGPEPVPSAVRAQQVRAKAAERLAEAEAAARQAANDLAAAREAEEAARHALRVATATLRQAQSAATRAEARLAAARRAAT